ncbi:MAG: MbtH family NRPS accessory protein [Candidatus Promineifilaceae bacterium]|nr:MbtH family NRPS accessory protein [Candidatus Promineifilaceae bacterium]
MAAPLFKVIVSTQEQYSVWPAGAELPLGWEEGALVDVSLEECLEYIGYVWRSRDMIVTDGYAVYKNDQDMLTVNLANQEPPEGWRQTTDALSLAEALNFIREAWLGAGPLPEHFRPGTGQSPEVEIEE